METLIWFIISILLIFTEFFIPGLVIIFFGIGGILTTIVLAVFPLFQKQHIWQILLWLAFSGGSLIFLRKKLAKVFKGTSIAKQPEDYYAGKKATVIEPISPEKPGRIRFQGTSWNASTYDESFSPEETVEILKKEGNTFIVTRSIMEDT